MASTANESAFHNQANTTSSAHDDLDPASFLKTVRELSEKREREDAERYRLLEEEVEKSRALRAARRAERARSLSPEKMSTPSVSRATIAQDLPPEVPPASHIILSQSSSVQADRVLTPEPAKLSPTKDIPEFTGFGTTKKEREDLTRKDMQLSAPQPSPSDAATPSATSLARSGTLMWQRRPTVKPASHPTSISTETATNQRPTNSVRPAHAKGPDKDAIAASLATRDPAWFRQTPERGAASAAYRKSQENTPIDVQQGPRQLHGLAQEAVYHSPRPSGGSTPVSTKEVTHVSKGQRGGIHNLPQSSPENAYTSISKKVDLQMLIDEDASQVEASPMSQNASLSSYKHDSKSFSDTPDLSRSLARSARALDRPSSPTKGVGGFVQSAMLKRSDSVNKRWNVSTSGNTMGREDGINTTQHDLVTSRSVHTLISSTSTTSASTTIEPSADENTIRDSKSGPSAPMAIRHGRNKSIASLRASQTEDRTASPSSSPPKRWSPTKTSWIESALNKPEAPRSPALRNAPPSWMSDIAKVKAQKAMNDPASETNEKNRTSNSASQTPEKVLLSTVKSEASVVDRPERLLTHSQTPPHKPTAKSAQLLASLDVKPVTHSVTDSIVTPTLVEKNEELDVPAISAAGGSRDRDGQRPISRIGLSESPISVARAIDSNQTTDFRSALKSRPPAPPKPQETPEFLGKFGQLKRAHTEKYVAPDILKDNITRGKADLIKTGGFVKAPRKDELKAILNAKKDAIRKAKEEGRDLPGQAHQRKISPVPPVADKPEALAKLGLLAKSEVRTADHSSIALGQQEAPEALQRHRTIRSKHALPANRVDSGSDDVFQIAPPVTLSKQISLPAALEAVSIEDSRLSMRLNPGLANLLSRGPVTSTRGSETRDFTTSTGTSMGISSSRKEAEAEAPLHDMRKDRAKGPKKRKQAKTETTTADDNDASVKGVTAVKDRKMGIAEKFDLPSSRASNQPLGNAKDATLHSSISDNFARTCINANPPKPGKSSRIVSGQLQANSSNMSMIE